LKHAVHHRTGWQSSLRKANLLLVTDTD